MASDGDGTVAASETVEHGLCPSGLALGGRRQLENRAIVAAPTLLRCAVERALIVGDQVGEGTVAAA
jgi:hypothetical protein